MPVEKQEYDIIIIGGGIAGLYMAYKLIDTKKSILIIEKEQRYGGRIYTKYNQNGNEKLQYDAGPARISINHHKTLNLIKLSKLEIIKIKPKKEYIQINKNNTLEIKADISSKYSKLVINESANYSKDYLQSVSFYDLCIKILGKDKTEEFKNMFGYDAEFIYCNAYDSTEMFKKDFQNIGTYFIIKNGLSSLINYLLAKLKEHSNIHIIHNTEIRRFKYLTNNTNTYTHTMTRLYTTTKNTYDGRIIIWAIPKQPLSKITGWLKETKALFSSVEPISLHRIFCQFPHKNNTSWVSDISRTTTNDGLRQILPLSSEKGFIQIYCDSHWADYWNSKINRSKIESTKEILSHLHTVFPKLKSISMPTYVDSVFWQEGVHMWKPGFNSDVYYDKIQHIDPIHSIFVVGEAFSKHQCWIEGAVESVEDIYPCIISKLNE